MGLCVSRIHFENGIPSVEEIRNRFKTQTGLYISIKASLNLKELPLNSREIIERLSDDISKYEIFRHKEFDGDLNKRWKEEQKINHIDQLQFYNYQFYGIDFYVQKNTIEMEYEIGCYYFPTSLNKCLFDLGGKFVDSNNELIKGWQSSKTWKRLKRWDDYKWYNRPKK